MRRNSKPSVTKETETHSAPLEFESKRRRTPTHHNDVSWYSKDPALIRDSASIPFAEPLGPVVEYGPNTRSIPGVAVIHYVPTVGPIGITAPGQAPINLAAVKYFSEIRKANAGARNYDPNDLIQILLGVAGIYEAIAFLKRVYSLLRDYQLTNRYYSRRLLEAQNIAFDDMLSHIAELRYFINVCISRTEVFAIPKDMSFLLRRIWMAESIFVDAPMRKAQTYLYTPFGIQSYDWGNARVQLAPWQDSVGNYYCTKVSEQNWSDGMPITFDVVKTTLEIMLSNMSLNTDVGIITGDLLKAYGESGIFRMSPIDADYHIEPLYNVEVLTQIHNLTTVLDSSTYKSSIDSSFMTTFDIIQSGALLTYNYTNGNPSVDGLYLTSTHCSPKIGSTNFGNVREDKLLLDMPIDPVSADNVMVATRLMAVRSVTNINAGAGLARYDLVNFGTEVVLGIDLFSLVAHFEYSTWLTNSSGVTVDDLIKYTVPFSFLPRGYVFVQQSDTPNTGEYSHVFDEIEIGTIDNYTCINSDVLFKMHQTAILSEFSVAAMPASNGRK